MLGCGVKFFDVGQRAQGFIAIGAQATGVIAIGQKERVDDTQASGYRRAMPRAEYFEGSELLAVPPAPWRRRGFWLKLLVRSLGVGALAAGWFFAVAMPLAQAFFAAKTGLFAELL